MQRTGKNRQPDGPGCAFSEKNRGSKRIKAVRSGLWPLEGKRGNVLKIQEQYRLASVEKSRLRQEYDQFEQLFWMHRRGFWQII